MMTVKLVSLFFWIAYESIFTPEYLVYIVKRSILENAKFQYIFFLVNFMDFILKKADFANIINLVNP